jgi:hypothetical protein
LVDPSRKIPNLSWPLATVPIKESCGRSGSFGFGATAAGFATGIEATGGAGGRRDDEKIGRSRVPGNAVNGIAHNGLPRSAGSCTGAGASAGAAGATMTCAGAADFSQVSDAAGNPAERASSGNTSVVSKVNADALGDDKARITMPITNLSIISDSCYCPYTASRGLEIIMEQAGSNSVEQARPARGRCLPSIIRR